MGDVELAGGDGRTQPERWDMRSMRVFICAGVADWLRRKITPRWDTAGVLGLSFSSIRGRDGVA
jgi:hypothetical protein